MTPDQTRLTVTALQSAKLRVLRGQPVFNESDLPQLLRELWADATGEDHLALSDDERRALNDELDAESLADDLRDNPAEALLMNRDEATDEDCTPEERTRATLRLVCALQLLSEDDWAPPALQTALERLEDNRSSDTPESDLHVAAPAITALLQVSSEAPEVAWHWLSRLNIPVPEHATLPMDTLRPVTMAAGPGPLLALRALGHRTPEDTPVGTLIGPGGLGAQRLLALASWRRGVYDRSRHPHLDMSDLRGAADELLMQADLIGPEGNAARAALTLRGTPASHPFRRPEPERSETRHDLLLTADGTWLQWLHHLNLPQINGFYPGTPESRLHNLKVKFAALPVLRTQSADEQRLHLSVLALLLCAADPNFPLPEPQARARHFSMPIYDLSLSDPEVTLTLQAMQTLTGVNPDDRALATEALSLQRDLPGQSA